MDRSEESLSAQFASEALSLCLELLPDQGWGRRLTFPGTVALNVSDGSVNGTVDIHMSSLLFAGGDLTHSARAEDTTSDMTQAVDSGRAFAIDANLDFAGYDRAGYELEFVSTPWLSSGFLAARGIGVPECASEPVQRDSYAVSQGCEGTSTTDLWRIEWTVEP